MKNLNSHFWIGLAFFVAGGVANGGVHLTDMIPASVIPYVIAWSSFISWIGTGYMTVAMGIQIPAPTPK